MYGRILISFCVAVLFSAVGYTMPHVPVADSLDVALDSMYAAENVVTDSIKVWDKGFDVRNYLNPTRQKMPVHTVFSTKSFFSNTFIGVRATATKVAGEDYGYGPTAGGIIGKWVHPAVGIRLGASLGYWYDNFDARKIREMQLSASVLFNMMSYLGGYDASRFCEMSVVAGAGYTYVWKSSGEKGNAFSGHVGLNVNMRVFDCLSIFVEPMVNLYLSPSQESSNRGIALSSAGNWRSYMTAYSAAVGMTYTFGQTRPENKRMSGSWKDSRNDWNGYFLYALGGLQFQANSRLVWTHLDFDERAGMHYSVGGGRWYNEFFGLRLSAAYARNNWIKYLAMEPYSSRYVSLRFEGMLDVLNMARYFMNKSNGVPGVGDHLFSLAVMVGPEMGHMLKRDRNRNIHDHYVGLVGGVQARFHVHKWISVLAEPRFSFVPYTAPHADTASVLNNMNYYDGLLNFNVGIEVRLPALHR